VVAAFMIFGVLGAMLLGSAASIVERVAASIGWARRDIWVGAMLCSLVLPAAQVARDPWTRGAQRRAGHNAERYRSHGRVSTCFQSHHRATSAPSSGAWTKLLVLRWQEQQRSDLVWP
jgi:hypothetical protein